MSPQQGNIQALENAIMAEAKREARQILEESRTKADRIKRESQLETEAECKTIIQQAEVEAEMIQSHAAAAAQLEAQNLKLQRREQLLAGVLNAARQRLSSVTQWPDYGDIVRELVREAAAKLNAEELRVRADAATQTLLTDSVLFDLSKEIAVRLVMGEVLSNGVGVILETPDGHRRYDNTLETRMQRIQESLRTDIYQILRGISH
ncbi:MAG: hypothetical protein JXA21_12170 [Anaerolineae bacterium]|nr:hypothetical protein [Anaerolineae bacterium]